MKRTIISSMVCGILCTPAESAKSSGGSRIGKAHKAKSAEQKHAEEIPGEVVTQIATTKGAKQGGDAVPAGKDHTRQLLEIAEAEAEAITGQISLMGTRMEQWQKVLSIAAGNFVTGKDGKTHNPVLKDYVRILTGKMLERAGLVRLETGEFPARESWPQQVVEVYQRQIGKRIAETRKVMQAAFDHFTDTRKVLEGKGNVHQKLAALPNPTARGRKAGTPNKNKGGNGGTHPDQTGKDGGTPASAPTGNGLGVIGQALRGLSFDALVEVANMVTMHLRQTKQFKAGGPAMELTGNIGNALKKYEVDQGRLDLEAERKAKRALGQV
jgi:hypothetical protein